MKHKSCFSVTLILFSAVALSQPGKVPLTPKGKPGTMATKPMKVTAKVALGLSTYEYSSDNGHVDISYARSKGTKNDVTTTSTPAKSAMCLTKEEVRGQKIENELIIADGSKAVQILPGGVIDADVLLKSGEFKYMKMDNRKPISISTTSNLARKTSETVNPGRNNNIEDELRSKVHALTRPSNLIGMPNVRSSSEASVSTLQETTGINIGASFFYMGVSADNNFRFSSEQYRFMYLYQFEQECLPVIANGISSPEEIFKDVTGVNNNWLYIREVKYGRRLYVLMESEYDLAKYSNDLNGNLEWGVVSAALSVKTKGSSLSEKTNIRILTQGGQPVAVTDKSKLQSTLDNYFASKFSEMDIVPLSYKLTYLDGEPVSMISNAFLNGNNCLDKNKIRVRVTKIQCQKIDDNKNNEEIYGSANIALFNTAG